MYIWVTILAMLVVIPFAVGVRVYNRIPSAYRIVVWLCGVWTVAEIYSFTLRSFGISNAHVSYVLTVLEVWLFSYFYRLVTDRHRRTFMVTAYIGFVLVMAEAVSIGGPLNTYSLAVEYVLLTAFALYLFYLIVIGRVSSGYLVINFIFLFYLLSSFPYFFAWEWLRINNMELLRMLADVHVVVHSICYLALTYTIWKSSLSYSAR